MKRGRPGDREAAPGATLAEAADSGAAPAGNPAPRGVERLGMWIATGLGIGRLRPAPGTLGSAAGLATFVVLLAATPLWAQLGAGVALLAIGCWASAVAARRLGQSDPADVVVDEWAAMWLAAAGLSGAPAWVAAFFCFRLFDIVKPFPAGAVDRLSDRVPWLGIMGDDVVAALYTQLAVRLALGWWGGGVTP